MDYRYIASSRRFLVALISFAVILCACPPLRHSLPTPAGAHSRDSPALDTDHQPTSPHSPKAGDDSLAIEAVGGIMLLQQQSELSKTCPGGGDCGSNPLPFLQLPAM